MTDTANTLLEKLSILAADVLYLSYLFGAAGNVETQEQLIAIGAQLRAISQESG